MTIRPRTLGRQQTLARARELMCKHGIRHIPVLDCGKLVGIVSERDLRQFGAGRDRRARTPTVGKAMSRDLYTVESRTSVRLAAQEMERRKHGSAIVVDHGRVVGIFTTTDALRALGDAISHAAAPPARHDHAASHVWRSDWCL